ncbi:MAG: hypothetical protein J1F09_00595 [Oscillospiraceae bacterium]|nr:hypothetical protein [Oscillospiraceae bacterium]
MKNNELFDILGEIDDRFYEEAREEDIEAMPIRLKAEKPPVWQIVAKAAACVALVAAVGFVAAYFINKIDVLPYNPNENSENSGYAEYTESNNFSVMDIYECNKELSTKYGVQSRNTRIMDINFDGIDEIVMLTKAPSVGVHVFSRTVDGMRETGVFAQDENRSYLESLDDLYEYKDENGKRYWYYGFRYQDYDSEIKMDANVAAAVKFDGKKYYIEHLLSHGLLMYNTPQRLNINFYRIGWNSDEREFGVDYNDVPNVEFYELWHKYPGLDEMHCENYSNDGFEYKLENYPMIEMDKVPDLSSEFGYLFPSLEMRAATIDVKKWGPYELRLLGEFIHTESAENPGVLYVESLTLALCKDGKIITTEWFHLACMATAGGRDRYELYTDMLDEYIQLFDLNSSAVAVFNYDLPERKKHYSGIDFDNESTFLAIFNNNGDMTLEALMGNTSATGGSSVGYNVHLSHKLETNGNIITDVNNGIMYCFYPQYFGGNPWDNPQFVSSYTSENPNTDPKDDIKTFDEYVIDTDKIGEYTVKLVGRDVTVTSGMHDVWAVMKHCTQIEYSNVSLVLEKNGAVITAVSVKEQLPIIVCETEVLSSFIKPFEMKDGVGFILYTDLNYMHDVTFEQCDLYMLKSDKPIKLVRTGEQHWSTQISRGAEVDYNSNKIGSYVIDFSNGTYYLPQEASDDHVMASGANYCY